MIGRLAGFFAPPDRRVGDKSPQVIEVRHAGECYGIEVRRSPSARRLILRVRGATRDAVLTIPKRTSLADARSFAERQAAWVGARLRRLPETVTIEAGAVIPVRGVSTLLLACPSERGVAWLDSSRAGGDAVQALCIAGDPAHLSRRASDWLRRECRRDLERAVAQAAAALGKKPPPITLRDTASRWGSCTSSGRLNFSWRLILAPSFVLDYLAAHEVAHLVHMNHSPKYWALCRSLNTDTDRAEAWLNTQGTSLHRYRVTPLGARPARMAHAGEEGSR